MMCTWGGWAGLSFLSSGQKERIHRKNQTLKKKKKSENKIEKWTEKEGRKAKQSELVKKKRISKITR